MFGYVKVNRPELKIREYARYKGFYCGLCTSLGKRHGALGRMTLTYDMTFLVLLLSSLYEPETREEKKRCFLHPAGKQYVLRNEVTDYAADMNVLLAQGHMEDDWTDERKLTGLFGAGIFRGKKKKIAARYPRQAQVIEASLLELSEREREECRNLDAVAGPFGNLMAELFAWQEDAFGRILRPFGFYLGKYIYILDAYNDLPEDLKKGCYNPFTYEWQKEGFHDRVQGILENTLRMAVTEFEKLPCQQDLPILRNILYEGIRQNRKDREEENGGRDERSLSGAGHHKRCYRPGN